MNTAKITSLNLDEDGKVDRTPMLRHQAEKLSKTIQAVSDIANSEAWKILKEEVFDGLKEALYRRIATETDEKKIYHLQGELQFATMYSDFEKFADGLRKQLEGYKKQLNAKSQETS